MQIDGTGTKKLDQQELMGLKLSIKELIKDLNYHVLVMNDIVDQLESESSKNSKG